jgi:hypothetical protein
MNRDFVEMLSALVEARAEFLIVGAHALAAHGVPRATGDLDIWIRSDEENADRVLKALETFGAPRFDLTRQDLARPGTVFQIGVPPSRIDILTSISGVAFDQAWPNRTTIQIGELVVPVLGKSDFVVNKRAVGRPRDLSDLNLLDEAERGL